MTARRSTPWRSLIAGLLLCVISPTSAAAGTTTAQAPPFSMTAVSVSPWVGPDGTWTAVVEVPGPPVEGSTISYTLHRPIAGSLTERRRRIAAIAGGDDAGPELQSKVTQPASGIVSGTRATISIPIRSRGGSPDRVLVPNPGVHPVVIESSGPDGTVSSVITLFLNRLKDVGKRPPLRVGAELALSGPPSFTTTGLPQVEPATAAGIAALLDAVTASTTPVSLSVDPSIFDALRLSPSTQTEAAALADAVQNHPIVRNSWAPIDMESWASTGEFVDIQTQVVKGQQTMELARAQHLVTRVWPPDSTLGPKSITTLRQIGVDRLVVSDDQLVGTRSGGDDPLGIRSIRVGTGDQAIVALSLIDEIQTMVRDQDSDPVLAANAVTSMLEEGWATSTTDDQLGSVVSLDEARPEMVGALLDALDEPDNPTMSVTAVDAVFEGLAAQSRTPRRNGPTTPVSAQVEAPPPVDSGGVSRRLVPARTNLFAYQSSITEAPDRLDLERRSLLSQHRDFVTTVQFAVLAAIEDQVSVGFGKITAAPPRSVTVTSRKVRLSIRVNNGLDRPARVLMKVRSTRVELDGGANRLIDLRPGTNRLDLVVTVRTSGQFNVGVDFRSADDQYLITRTAIRIRSSVFSGVGVVLSFGAGLFLILWWVRTLRRERRQRSVHPSRNTPTRT